MAVIPDVIHAGERVITPYGIFHKTNWRENMPVGWATTPQGKRRVLAKLDERITTLQDRKNALVTKAGEAALNRSALSLDGVKREYESVTEKIALLSEVRRDVVNTDDLEW